MVRWNEDGTGVFQHSGNTFKLNTEDLGLVEEHTSEVGIDSKFPLVVSERVFVTNDGRTIRNISMTHELIGLISDYYIYNETPITEEGGSEEVTDQISQEGK